MSLLILSGGELVENKTVSNLSKKDTRVKYIIPEHVKLHPQHCSSKPPKVSTANTRAAVRVGDTALPISAENTDSVTRDTSRLKTKPPVQPATSASRVRSAPARTQRGRPPTSAAAAPRVLVKRDKSGERRLSTGTHSSGVAGRLGERVTRERHKLTLQQCGGYSDDIQTAVVSDVIVRPQFSLTLIEGMILILCADSFLT